MAKRNFWKWVDDPITYKRLSVAGAIIVALGGLLAYFDAKSWVTAKHETFQICRGEYLRGCVGGSAHIGCPNGDWVKAYQPNSCSHVDSITTIQSEPGNACGYNTVVFQCRTWGLF
jgi:hypothetical protein